LELLSIAAIFSFSTSEARNQTIPLFMDQLAENLIIINSFFCGLQQLVAGQRVRDRPPVCANSLQKSDLKKRVGECYQMPGANPTILHTYILSTSLYIKTPIKRPVLYVGSC
jgi:hypothetical protein